MLMAILTLDFGSVMRPTRSTTPLNKYIVHCGRVIVGKRNLTYHIRNSHEMAKCNKCNKGMKKNKTKSLLDAIISRLGI